MTDTKIDTTEALALAHDLRVLIARLHRMMREQAGGSDLTPSQKAVLLRLEADGPSTVTAIAKALGVRSQSMGATVSTLEDAGYVSGAADPNDGRQKIWSLAPGVREKILAGRAARQDWLYQTIRSKIDESEQHDLAAGIDLLKRLVDI